MAFAPPPESPIPTLDLRGLKCPMPVLRTRKALRGMAPGARLEVLCTDPLAAIDIPHCLRESGDVLEAQGVEADMLRFVIRKGDPEP
ncbi:sulfurtransferase TusA family protein [Beijerinckia sp. L45]|uniref:sulfurtransferase TusA family protein n=1 Tax=Beijerinckia sp. L45 TaxID=1641855 RepID=UPI00131D42EF|nr:sulfurtransferase TusA family protein [Beijerinckia sp. L45]